MKATAVVKVWVAGVRYEAGDTIELGDDDLWLISQGAAVPVERRKKKNEAVEVNEEDAGGD